MNAITDQELCLKGLFMHLVDHGFHLSIRDYIDGLKALRAGYGTLDREQLCWLCLTLWARTPDEERYINYVFSLIPTPSDDEVATVIREITQPAVTEEIQRQERGARIRNTPHTASRQQLRRPVSEKSEVGALFSAPKQDGLGVPRANVRPASLEPFILNQKPIIPMRDLVVILRRFRRSVRFGPPVELDIEASIKETCRLGFLHKPVYIPARRNQARLNIFIDVSTSMVTWRSFNPVLLAALKESTLEHWSIYYFDNVPDEEVFEEDTLYTPRSLLSVLSDHPDTPCMFISDAGAARGYRKRSRIRDTSDTIDLMRQNGVGNMVWINPMPTSRWAGTSALAISRKTQVPMVELNQNGLIHGIDILRGTKGRGAKV